MCGRDPLRSHADAAEDPFGGPYPLADALLRDWRQPTAERVDRALRAGVFAAHPSPPSPLITDGRHRAPTLSPAQRRALDAAPRLRSGSAGGDPRCRWARVAGRHPAARAVDGPPGRGRGRRAIPRGRAPLPAAIRPVPLPVALPGPMGRSRRLTCGLLVLDEEVVLVPRRGIDGQEAVGPLTAASAAVGGGLERAVLVELARALQRAFERSVDRDAV